MNNEWRVTTIGNEVTLQRGYDITRKEQNPGKVPVISSSGINSYHDTALVKAPGVIIGRKGSLGTVFYIEEDYWPHDTTLWIKDFYGNYPKFVYYFFKTLNLLALNVGTASPTLNRNHVHPIKTLWPTITEQKAIAQILSSLDDKIELNQQMNETLEAMARAMFKSWFVDFDPVRAKMEGRQPAGMDAATADLFPDEFEESSLGLIPKGWQVGVFDELINILSGGTPKTSVVEYWNGNIKWFSVKDAPNSSDVFVIDTEKRITQLGVEKSAAQILPKGTSIITARGTVGKPGLARLKPY